jgi:hypothetical protein
MFQPISTDRFDKPESEFKPGPAPQLNWLDIKDLVVDMTYQREIGKRGAANIRQIAENFDWSKFALRLSRAANGPSLTASIAPPPR